MLQHHPRSICRFTGHRPIHSTDFNDNRLFQQDRFCAAQPQANRNRQNLPVSSQRACFSAGSADSARPSGPATLAVAAAAGSFLLACTKKKGSLCSPQRPCLVLCACFRQIPGCNKSVQSDSALQRDSAGVLPVFLEPRQWNRIHPVGISFQRRFRIKCQ